MQGLHRQVNARRDHASLEAAVPPDHVQRDGGPAVDNDQWPRIEPERAERIDQTVRSDLRGLAGPHLDAELETRVLRAVVERARAGATVVVVGHRDRVTAIGDGVVYVGGEVLVG